MFSYKSVQLTQINTVLWMICAGENLNDMSSWMP